uniref:Uncharacterized protein n=1 Tax=Physcomitrium patens TaxID=3218 RepID=A0A2K1IJN7_PHYPA|nr:hypothetical protein PHYPA_028184 [Physcomitrium patens]
MADGKATPFDSVIFFLVLFLSSFPLFFSDSFLNRFVIVGELPTRRKLFHQVGMLCLNIVESPFPRCAAYSKKKSL